MRFGCRLNGPGHKMRRDGEISNNCFSRLSTFMFSKKTAKDKEAELQLKAHCEHCGGRVDNSSEGAGESRCTCVGAGPETTENHSPQADSTMDAVEHETFGEILVEQKRSESERKETSENSATLPDLGDRFEVLEFLGEGGMGSVYKVREKTTSAIMAAKVIKTGGCEDAEAVKRFESEVSAATKLTHPNIVATFDHGKTADGAPYMVMNFIEGDTLAKYVKEHGKLEEADAIKLFIDIAEALGYAHQQGLIHRDLKPSNVIVTGDKESKTLDAHLVDFGIAKAMTASMARDTQDITKTGEVFGSPAYMSPEQCLGFRLDARSDIYSFGCLMYEALTGNAPLSDENPVRIVVKQLSEKPKSWTNTPDGKPLKGIEAIVFRCLEKDKEERYQTVAELMSDLKLVASGKKVAKLERSQFGKASLTLMQAITIALLGFFLLLYLTSITVSYIYSFFGLVLFPVALALLIRHLMVLKFEGTNWNRWQLLLLSTMTLVGLTGTIVFSGVLTFWENLPTAFHYFYAIDSVLHKAALCLAGGLVIAAFTFHDSANLSWKRIAKQAALISMPILLLAFIPLGAMSSIIPSSMVMGLTMSDNQNTPKVNIALAKTGMSLGGDKTWAANMLAENYQKLNDSAAALPYLNAAIEADPNSRQLDDALENRARAYISQGEFGKALQDLDKALKINSTGYSAASYYELQGDAYKGLGENENAISAYQKSTEGDLTNNTASDKLIGLLIKMQDWKRTIDALNNNIATDYGAESVLRRAIVYEKANLKDKAKVDYEYLVKSYEKISDKEPQPFQLDEPTFTIYRIVRLLNPPEDYRKIVGKTYLIRAYANHQLGNLDQASKDLKEGQSRGATFSHIDENFQKFSGLKINL